MNPNRSYLIAFWSPFSTAEIEPYTWYFTSAFCRYGDIQCLDCRDNRDMRTRRLLHQADLVVLVLRQSRRELSRLVCHCDLRFQNVVLLIMDYVEDSPPTLRDLAVEFRIPLSRLACVPYSPRSREGKKTPGSGCFSTVVRRELARAGHRMLQALGF